MAYNTKPIITDVDGNPISQYYNKELDHFEPVEGANGANKVLVENNDLSLIPILDKLSQLTGTVIDEETRKSNELQRQELYNQILNMLNTGQLKGDKGDTGNGLEFNWVGTGLGVRIEGQIEYIYVDLQGPQGPQGPAGDIDNLTSQHVKTALGYTPVKSVNNAVADEIGNVELDIDTSEIENRIDNVENNLDAHKAEKATQDGYGHIRLQDIPNPKIATQVEAETGTNNTKMMTPLRVANAIDSKVRVIDNKVEINVNGQWLTFIYLPDDESGSPGDTKLIAGDWNTGFFGEVSSSELITGDALASQVGISQGTSQHSTAGWLKFAWKGNIQFVAKKPIRNSISWDAINTAKCVYGDAGDKRVTIGGLTYKVRLMRALSPALDPKTTASANSGEVNHGSEWNRLMCQIHEQATDKSWDYPSNVESNIGMLKHNLGNGNQGMYSDADLVVRSGDGRYSWCQEMSTSTSSRLIRGNYGVSSSYGSASSYTGSLSGWRPVLELVP